MVKYFLCIVGFRCKYSNKYVLLLNRCCSNMTIDVEFKVNIFATPKVKSHLYLVNEFGCLYIYISAIVRDVY